MMIGKGDKMNFRDFLKAGEEMESQSQEQTQEAPETNEPEQEAPAETDED